MPETVLAFDIGIRNLAWCLMEKKESRYTVLGWQNYDLLKGEGKEETKAVTCYLCKTKPKYFHGDDKLTCVRHCPPLLPPLTDLSGTRLMKIPAMKELRKLLPSKTIKNKADGEAELAKSYSLPIVKVKVKKAVDHELTVIHDAIRKFIQDTKPLFLKATHILLENQPVLKNPTMKTVQILLFATLRDLLTESKPSLHLVHAGKKVQGVEKGDAGYKERKDGAEKRVAELLEKSTEDGVQWKTFFTSHQKKNDLADAFSMAVDRLCKVASE